MDTKKLDKWADLLLDTGKRNNLINFKDTRASTVEVLLPSSDVLFEKVDGTASFEVFDPKIVEEDDDSEESYAPKQFPHRRIIFLCWLAHPRADGHSDLQELPLHCPSNPGTY